MAALDRSIAEYRPTLTANDQAEGTAAPASAPPAGGDIAEKFTALRQRRAAAALAKLADSGDGQLSRTDPDARLLGKHGQVFAPCDMLGYGGSLKAPSCLIPRPHRPGA